MAPARTLAAPTRRQLAAMLPQRSPRALAVSTGELLFTVSVVFLYFLARGSHPDDVPASVSRTIAIVDLEKHLGVFYEADIQSAFLGHHWVVNLANMIYVWGMYPTLTALAAWLAFTDIKSFRYARNLMFVSAVMGLIGYWLIPAAPPRLLGAHGYTLGFVDTLHSPTSAVKDHQLGIFLNEYAALPSFHFAWVAFAAITVWCNTRNVALRAVAAALPVLMFWAIIVTANHLFFDLFLGVITVLAAWLVTNGIYRVASVVRTSESSAEGRHRGLHRHHHLNQEPSPVDAHR